MLAISTQVRSQQTFRQRPHRSVIDHIARKAVPVWLLAFRSHTAFPYLPIYQILVDGEGNLDITFAMKQLQQPFGLLGQLHEADDLAIGVDRLYHPQHRDPEVSDLEPPHLLTRALRLAGDPTVASIARPLRGMHLQEGVVVLVIKIEESDVVTLAQSLGGLDTQCQQALAVLRLECLAQGGVGGDGVQQRTHDGDFLVMGAVKSIRDPPDTIVDLIIQSLFLLIPQKRAGQGDQRYQHDCQRPYKHPDARILTIERVGSADSNDRNGAAAVRIYPSFNGSIDHLEKRCL